MEKIKEMTMTEVKKALGYDFKLVTEHKKMLLSDVSIGECKKIGDTEFIILEHISGVAICLTKDFVFKNTKFDSNTNNYADSSVKARLESEFLPNLIEKVGTENVLFNEIDLTTDDGLTDYGKCTSQISLLTDVQYRKYSEIIEQYPVDDWWWLANAVSTPRRDIQYSVRCVASVGIMNRNDCDDDLSVRAVCIFKSNIFVSE